MRAPSEYRCAILDCDGVILDSNAAKSAAFRETLATESAAHVETFLREHRRSGGVSRYVKLERFYREVKHDPRWGAETAAALARFGECCRRALATCPLVPGVERVLGTFGRLGIPAHVISGGDQTEVRQILGERGLSDAFASIRGSPRTKLEHLADLRDAGRLPAASVYFGDARSDLDAAEHCGLDFVFVSGFTDWPEGASVARERGHSVIRDFEELLAAH